MGLCYSERSSQAHNSNGFLEMSVCKIVFEACASAHHWGRTAINLGHEVRLIAPAHVKPFVKRHKNDLIDAEATTEAAMRPSIRFVAVKSKEQQLQAVAFRARELLVRQRTQLINAFRAHLAEVGIAINKGPRRTPSSRVSTAVSGTNA